MDSFEINKILGAILFTCLVMLSLNIAAGAMFSPAKPAKPGYEVAVTGEPAQGAKPEAAAPAEPIEKLLASASVEKGEQAAKKCAACHTFTKGGPNRVGPNLWGIVNRPKASEAGFAYSDAIKSKGGDWNVDDLNKFLHNPRGFAAGTKMSFAGLQRENQRADVIAYLNTLSDSPKPLPTAAAPAKEGQAAGGQAAPQGQSAPGATPGAKPSPPSGRAETQTPGPTQPQVTSPGQSQAPQPGSPKSPAPGQKSE